jgi:hypothetical protein
MAVASARAVSASDCRISAVMADWVVQVDGSAWEYARIATEKASRIGRERRRRTPMWARGCGVPVLRTRRREASSEADVARLPQHTGGHGAESSQRRQAIS